MHDCKSNVVFFMHIISISKVFKKCFKRLQSDGFFEDVEPSQIFANIDEIHDANIDFWKLLVTVVENSRKSRQPMKPGDLINAFDRVSYLHLTYHKENIKISKQGRGGLLFR